MASRKRSSSMASSEVECISDVVAVSSNANLQGVVTVSPMRKGKGTSYFDGMIADGKGSLRLYGFDSNVRRRLLETMESGKGGGVVLKHCEIKRAKHGGDLEVIITGLHSNISFPYLAVYSHMHQYGTCYILYLVDYKLSQLAFVVVLGACIKIHRG